MDATEIRRLTELAALAAGRKGEWDEECCAFLELHGGGWLPDCDDNDSFGLMCALNMNLYISDAFCCTEIVSNGDEPGIFFQERCTPETRREAARLAVLRAAAALGEQMETTP